MLHKVGFMDVVSAITELMALGRIRGDDPFKASRGTWAALVQSKIHSDPSSILWSPPRSVSTQFSENLENLAAV